MARKNTKVGRKYTQKEVQKFLGNAKTFASHNGWCAKSKKNSKTKGGANRCAMQRKAYVKLYMDTLKGLKRLQRLKAKKGEYMIDPFYF